MDPPTHRIVVYYTTAGGPELALKLKHPDMEHLSVLATKVCRDLSAIPNISRICYTLEDGNLYEFGLC